MGERVSISEAQGPAAKTLFKTWLRIGHCGRRPAPSEGTLEGPHASHGLGCVFLDAGVLFQGRRCDLQMVLARGHCQSHGGWVSSLRENLETASQLSCWCFEKFLHPLNENGSNRCNSERGSFWLKINTYMHLLAS